MDDKSQSSERSTRRRRTKNKVQPRSIFKELKTSPTNTGGTGWRQERRRVGGPFGEEITSQARREYYTYRHGDLGPDLRH